MIRNTPMTGEIACEKAEFFYSKITNKGDFKASAGRLLTNLNKGMEFTS
jgi:hypothetical protein